MWQYQFLGINEFPSLNRSFNEIGSPEGINIGILRANSPCLANIFISFGGFSLENYFYGLILCFSGCGAMISPLFSFSVLSLLSHFRPFYVGPSMMGNNNFKIILHFEWKFCGFYEFASEHIF